MNRIIFDSSALLAYFLDAPGATGMEEWLKRLTTETDLQGCMTSLAAGELFYTALRRKNEATAERAHRMLLGLPIALGSTRYGVKSGSRQTKSGASGFLSCRRPHGGPRNVQQQGMLVAADNVFDALRGLPFFSVQYL